MIIVPTQGVDSLSSTQTVKQIITHSDDSDTWECWFLTKHETSFSQGLW